MAHSTRVVPAVSPVIVEVGPEGVVTIPAPETTVHVPVPVVGVFPAKVAVLAQMDWLGPASEAVGGAST